MKYRKLGASGLAVSEISLGSWLTYGADVNDDKAFACLDAAIEAGINHFDTADVYNRGEAEKVVGRYLKQANRKHLIIATKCFFPMSGHWMDSGLSYRHILNSCEQSLERLDIDRIDLYISHRYDPKTPLDETIYAYQHLIEKGMINYWGVSQWSAVQITNAVRICEKNGWRKPVSNQPIYNMLNRSLEIDVMEVCENEGLGLTVYSPLAQGILSGKYSAQNTPEDARSQKTHGSMFFSFKRLNETTFKQLEKLKKVAEKLNVTMSQLALAWTLRKTPVSSAIIGASRPEQVLENVKAVELSLNVEVQAKIETILNNHPVDQYTGQLIGHGIKPLFG